LSINSNEEKIAWITGATGGIGIAISRELRENGWNVVELRRQEINLSDYRSVTAWTESHSNTTPDLIVCNAAGNEPKELTELDSRDFLFWLENNFLGHVEIVQSVIQEMALSRKGSVIFISSAYSVRSRVGRSQYSVTKAAQDAYMRSLALEFAPYGLTINSVSPGFINTTLTQKNNSPEAISKIVEQIPLARLGTPEEVAKLVSFLASEANSYITGQNISIDGGFSLR
jgi:NAD(P)-dependent dehydrogenase (short-subunit alcohol dehydrogenase family)